MMVKGNRLCWASFCSYWCSAISLDLQPALHLPKISPLICVYTCMSLHAGSIPAFPFGPMGGKGNRSVWSGLAIFMCLHFYLPPQCPWLPLVQPSVLPFPTWLLHPHHLFFSVPSCTAPRWSPLLFATQPLLTGMQWSHNCLQLVN